LARFGANPRVSASEADELSWSGSADEIVAAAGGLIPQVAKDGLSQGEAAGSVNLGLDAFCEFRSKPATDSETIPATIPI
jgi:hypothetical protein